MSRAALSGHHFLGGAIRPLFQGVTGLADAEGTHRSLGPYGSEIRRGSLGSIGP